MNSVIPPGDRSRIAVIGKSQGYRGLAVHFGETVDSATGSVTPQLTTAYIPTPAEIAAIVAGAPIVISLINVARHPPIAVYVGSVPE